MRTIFKQSVFNELYDGTTDFNFEKRGPDEAFLRITQEKQEHMEKLIELLDDTGKELFEAYRKSADEVAEKEKYNAFAGALRFGTLFMAEVFMVGEDWADEGNEPEE